jgi:adenosyl cobinamide kinase/adenosyl cobinamide phosphate guanylyltransferase
VITLVLGGARSGKSLVAETLAARAARAARAPNAAGAPNASVTYVATIQIGTDADMAARVALHQQRRPADWSTVEVAAGEDLPRILRTTTGPVLLDALGPWVAAHDTAPIDATSLCNALQGRTGDTVVVSEEVGLGVHPSTEAGRLFRDALGTLNQAVAAVSDRVLLVIAGRVMPLEALPLEALPPDDLA